MLTIRLLLLLTTWALVASGQATFDPLLWVDPLIGSTNDGHVFAGASLPYGMAKAVADTDGSDNQGGFRFGNPSVNITEFSSLHDSGTGGAPSLGNFPIFPQIGCPDNDINRCSFTKPSRRTKYNSTTVEAEPGYFSIDLASGIKVEMTTSQHAALYKFTFPKDTDEPMILLDLTDLHSGRTGNSSVVVDPNTGRIVGQASFEPSFGVGTYTAFVCTDFAGANIKDSGIFVDNRATAEVHQLVLPDKKMTNSFPLPGGAWVRFAVRSESAVLARVGLSMISVDQACSNAEREIADFDSEKVKNDAQQQWRQKLGSIRVSMDGIQDEGLLTSFFSGVYRTMISPQDYTGENPLWQSSEPYFDSFYCLWDSFRSQIPFLIIVDPHAVAQMVRSLIDTFTHEGWLPDCRMSLCKGLTQGGSNADIVLADAFVKGLRDGIDWDLGFEAVVKDAEVEPFDWCCHGRGGLDSWKELGYIPVQDFDHKGFGTLTRSISRTLEYSYNDFTIAQIASGLGGKQSDVQKYQNRSTNWANLFRTDQRSMLGKYDSRFAGFFQSRHANRTWGSQDPLYCSNLDMSPQSVCSLQPSASETYESSIWEYSFFVPHDQAALIEKFGGSDEFVRRLDFLHDQHITLISNEPSFLTVFQYHYAGRPGLSAKRAHYYIPAAFAPTPEGLPGNDDSGAMGSFLAFAMMGLFPNPGQNVYLITPPFFKSVSVTSPSTNKTATISVSNFDAEYKNIFIQSASLNGQQYMKNWIDHSFFLEGKELVLTVGQKESAWGTAVQDRPPSLTPYQSSVNSRTSFTTVLLSRTLRSDSMSTCFAKSPSPIVLTTR